MAPTRHTRRSRPCESRATYEPIHSRRSADLQVAIWIGPDEQLSVRVTDAGGDFTVPARDGHDALEKFWHPYVYEPRKEA